MKFIKENLRIDSVYFAKIMPILLSIFKNT
jgi:hypothetical protein